MLKCKGKRRFTSVVSSLLLVSGWFIWPSPYLPSSSLITLPCHLTWLWHRLDRNDRDEHCEISWQYISNWSAKDLVARTHHCPWLGLVVGVFSHQMVVVMHHTVMKQQWWEVDSRWDNMDHLPFYYSFLWCVVFCQIYSTLYLIRPIIVKGARWEAYHNIYISVEVETGRLILRIMARNSRVVAKCIKV
jgi:hypothetical protein